jgi:predicted transposase YdaD
MEEKPDRSPFDTVMKQLVGGNPQAWVSFLLNGAVFKNDLNRELRTRKIEADVLYDVEWDDEPVILHIEFQRRRDNNMPKRVWEYSALTRIATNKLVYSVVIYPVEIPSITEGVYTMSLRNGDLLDWFTFKQIKLWEIEPEVFEQPHLTGLLPLLPLTKNGQSFETVERMFHKMKLAGMGKEAFSMAGIVVGLVLTSEQDKQRLKARFQTMSNILEESWVYQEILQKGEQRGIEQGIEKGIEKGQKQEKEQDILLFVELCFPSLLPQAKQVIERAMPLEQLQTLLKKLYLAKTIEEASAALQEVGRDV